MAYTTVAKIRQEAGFQSNANVTDPVITQYQTRAYNEVRSWVSGRYSLSLFSGAGFTGSQAESVLELCELLLAAGRLMMSQFQGQPIGEAKGKEKVDQALAMLKQIASGELRLIDANGDQYTSGATQEQGGSAEYTAPAREVADHAVSEKKFSVEDRF